MAILNFTGFETGNFVEIFTGFGLPAIMAKADGFITKSGDYSLMLAGDYGDGIHGIYFGEILGGYYTPMNRSLLFTRFYFNAVQLPTTSSELFSVTDTDGFVKLSLRIDSVGQVELRGYTLSDSLSGIKIDDIDILQQGKWYRIEVKCQAAGNYEIKINGVTKSIGLADLGTANNKFACLGNANDATADEDYAFYYDDLKMSNTEFPGPGFSALLPVIYEGNHTLWGGTYINVQEAFDDLYIEGTESEISTFELQDRPDWMFGNVNSVKVIALTKAGGSGEVAMVKPLVRTYDTDYTIDNPLYYLNETDFMIGVIYSLNPNTEANWTLEEIDSLEAGVISTDDTTLAYCDYITVGVDFY
jgi:hypothetical protein